MCGTCHSRNTDLTGDFKPGDSFYDHYSLEILDNARRWYPDGQIKDEDYEFASFLGSKMYQAGVTCLDCHPRDVNKPQLKGNAMCMRCHNGGYPKAIVIDPAGHGHHKLADKGGECAGCHLPVTVYMQRHPRHDHGLHRSRSAADEGVEHSERLQPLPCGSNDGLGVEIHGPMVWREDEPTQPGAGAVDCGGGERGIRCR
jgi:hypothetical protein